jgi:ABC-type transporter Mla subunit MlaD
MRKVVLALIVVVGLTCTWLAFRKPQTRDQNLKSYFQRGSSLKAGAPVCVDGVKSGVVKSVRVHPELGERPVEVLISIRTGYELRIPNDSTVIFRRKASWAKPLPTLTLATPTGPLLGATACSRVRK